MKGLWKYIAPFAPDQSGAAAVLYGLGGIVVICDAGGCAGNICGFDEPRWFSGGKSAVFSAGLRDMDAILGRDDRLVAKLCDAAGQIEASFAAIVGTPVPSVIGTDYRALQRMAEKKLDIPVVSIDTTGMALYDKGIEKAYMALLQAFAEPSVKAEKGTAGVLGALPLDLMRPGDMDTIRSMLLQQGWQHIQLYDCLDDFRQAGRAAVNFVISPAGLTAARYLRKSFGTAYAPAYFGLPLQFPDTSLFFRKKVLIVHQQGAAQALRKYIGQGQPEQVTAATWFMQPREWACDGDVVLREEDDFCRLADGGRFDVIVGDRYLKKALPHFTGTYLDFPHFAVSGRL